MTKYYWVTRDDSDDDRYWIWDKRPLYDGTSWVDGNWFFVMLDEKFEALTNIRLPKGKKGIMRIKGFRVVK